LDRECQRLIFWIWSKASFPEFSHLGNCLVYLSEVSNHTVLVRVKYYSEIHLTLKRMNGQEANSTTGFKFHSPTITIYCCSRAFCLLPLLAPNLYVFYHLWAWCLTLVLPIWLHLSPYFQKLLKIPSPFVILGSNNLHPFFFFKQLSALVTSKLRFTFKLQSIFFLVHSDSYFFDHFSTLNLHRSLYILLLFTNVYVSPH
jgi:hypothetical protein